MGGGVLGHLGAWGSPHMHAHVHTHVYMYRNLQMATDMEASMFIMFTTCMYMHACMGHPHTPIPTLTPIHTCHPQGGTPGISKNFITLELIKIILFEDLKSVENPPPMGGCIVWWVDGWVDGWGQVKSLKMLTQSRQFNSVKRFMICRDTPTYGLMYGLLGGSLGQWVWSGQITKNLINLDLIEIIQFYLKIYDL